MSQTQLHRTTSSEFAGHRRWRLIVSVLFTLSFLLVISIQGANVVFGGKAVPWQLSLSSVPLAAILAGVGAAIAARMPRRRLWLMVGIPVLALVAPFTAGIFVPLARSWSHLVFGAGGTLIITSVLLTCWFWAQERPKLHPAQRLGADLRLIAYVLFGIAAWWT